MKSFKSSSLIIIFSTIFLVITGCHQSTKQTGSGSTKATTLNDQWVLLPEQSNLSFVTTKNKVITEEHTLEFEQGEINKLEFSATIDLNSIDTQIEIRDQRLKDILFKTETYPTAGISSILPRGLNFGQTVELPFTLNLNGQTKTLTSKLLVQEVGSQLVVTNYDPISVNAKDFNLDSAVNQLTKIAGLQGINYEVLVDFKLTFENN